MDKVDAHGLFLLEVVEDMGNSVGVDDGHTYGSVSNVDCGHIDGHGETGTWSDVVSRSMIGGRNLQP